MNDQIQRAAEGALFCLNEIKLPVVPMNSRQENGSCTCGNMNCQNIGKHPIERGYYEKALASENEIISYIEKCQRPISFAALFDNSSPVLALDIDERNGGFESLSRLELISPDLTKTLSVRSGSGSLHFYFKVDPSLKIRLSNHLKDFPGIDIKKSSRELLILPGSIHKSGSEYKWENQMPIMDLPGAILDLLLKSDRKTTETTEQSDIIPEGQRNTFLYRSARKLFGKGLSTDLIQLALESLNSEKCAPPLSTEELIQIVQSAEKSKPSSAEEFCISDNKICHVPEGNLEKAYPITNFVAYISKQLERNDGGTGPHSRFYRIDFIHPKLDPPFEYVEPHELDECRWLSRKDGSLILLNPRFRDKLSIALRKLGNLDNRETVYISVGWVERNKKLLFIGTNGAIGADGFTEQLSASVDFGAPPYFEIGIPFSKQEVVQQWSVIQKLISVAPDQVSFALLATVFRAPLNRFFRGDFSVGLFGTTGTMKSTLAGLFLGFYGRDFNYNTLPESFASTPHSIERKAFLCNSVLVVIDDYVPGETKENIIEYLIRGAGNQQGRGRMNPDASLKKTYQPRCIYLITAEDLRVRPSLRARLVNLNLEKGDIDKEVLTELQKISEEGSLNRLMGNYVQWIINNEASIRSRIKDRFLAHRAELNKMTEHNRIGPNLAQLVLGLETFTSFAVETGMITVEQSQSWFERGRLAIVDLVKVQNEEQRNADPVSLFKQKLTEMLLGGQLHIAHPRPQDLGSLAKNIGYKIEGTWGHFAQGAKIGEFKDGELLMVPETIESKVLSEIRNLGTRYSLSHKALGKMLKEKNFLITEPGHTAIKRVIDGVRRRCWVIPNWLGFLDIDLSEDTLNAPKAPIAPQVLPVSLVTPLSSQPKKSDANGNKDLH